MGIIDAKTIRNAILAVGRDMNIMPADMAQVTLETGVEMFVSLRKLDMPQEELKAAFLEGMGNILDKALDDPGLTKIAEMNQAVADARKRKGAQ